MSNERVDVGTIMARDALDAAIRRQWDDVSYAQQCSEESEKARSAVAELIEAACGGIISRNATVSVTQQQRIACGEADPLPPHTTLTFNGTAADRLLAALSRIGGADDRTP